MSSISKRFQCAVASPHSLGTDAAREAIESDGNAIDAALAAATVLTVAYPHNTSIGGDLFALVRDPLGRISSINASGSAGIFTDVTHLRNRYGSLMPVTGVDSITVPGALGGLAALHGMGARLPWASAFARAIVHAEQGIPISSSLEAALRENSTLVDSDPGMSTLFKRNGHALSLGDILRNPALGATLRTIADEGPICLYGGEVGAALVEGLQSLGCVLSLRDFTGYRAQIEPALSAQFRDLQVWTSPPNSQGFALLEMLSIIDALPAGNADLFGEDADILAAIFQRAASDRTRLLADPSSCSSLVAQVLNEHYVSEATDEIVRHRPMHEPSTTAKTDRPTGDTVAVVTADSDGWAVSLIQSLFHSFGSGVLEPNTGLFLHNRGSFFSLDASSPNVIAPGKKPAHTLMPAMVTRGQDLAWVMGTMGGKAQPQILTQVLLRALSGDDVSKAVAQPRLIVGGLEVDQPENSIHLEPGLGHVEKVFSSWDVPVTVLPESDESAGHANLVSVSADGLFDAASDPRSDGSAEVVVRSDKQ